MDALSGSLVDGKRIGTGWGAWRLTLGVAPKLEKKQIETIQLSDDE
jgi:hypothetical protein